MAPKIDPRVPTGEVVRPEWFEHPTEGWLSFDPNNNYIGDRKADRTQVRHPISLPEKFIGTDQPFIPTCSMPGANNRGCPKALGCPFPKKYPYVGPGPVIMKDKGQVTSVNCYDYYEATRGGRPTSQLHYGMDGFELDTSRTTIDVLGRTAAVEAGKLDEESSRQRVMSSKPQIWKMEISGLLPPWWPLMKKKGLPLPEAAKLYPELTEEDEEEPSTELKAPSSPSRSRAGKKRRTSKVTGS